MRLNGGKHANKSGCGYIRNNGSTGPKKCQHKTLPAVVAEIECNKAEMRIRADISCLGHFIVAELFGADVELPDGTQTESV